MGDDDDDDDDDDESLKFYVPTGLDEIELGNLI